MIEYANYETCEPKTSIENIIFEKSCDCELTIYMLIDRYNEGLIPTLYYLKDICLIGATDEDKEIVIDVKRLRTVRRKHGYGMSY